MKKYSFYYFAILALAVFMTSCAGSYSAQAYHKHGSSCPAYQ